MKNQTLAENHVEPTTIGGTIASFFRPFKNNSTALYYPGISNMPEETFEQDYRRIVAEMQSYAPDLNIETVGITLDRTCAESRKKDFDKIHVENITQMSIDGILFLPQFSKWLEFSRDKLDPCSQACQYLELISSGGILFYQLNEDMLMSEYGINRFIQSLDDRLDGCSILPVNSKKYGGSLAVKQYKPDKN